MKLQFDITKKYAIALEGGGAKGAYEIGVWKALAEAGVQFQAVAGASVGALNGALMAMGDLEKAVALWENITFSQVINVDDEFMGKVYKGEMRGKELRDFLKGTIKVIGDGGFDIKPLRRLLSQVIDEEKIRASEMDFYLVTYSLTDKQELDLDAKTLPKGKLHDMLLASAYLPAFKQEELDGKKYTDGCLANLVPISSLLDRGYKDIIVIRIYGFGFEKKVKIPSGVKMTVIAPQKKLGGMLQFEKEQSKRDMTLGYFDGLRMLYGLAGQSYYIDSEWDEGMAYAVLRNLLERDFKKKGVTVSLRQLHEEALPHLAKRLKAKGSYYDILIALLERMAEEMGITSFSIYTEAELVRLLWREKEKKQPKKGIIMLLQ